MSTKFIVANALAAALNLALFAFYGSLISFAAVFISLGCIAHIVYTEQKHGRHRQPTAEDNGDPAAQSGFSFSTGALVLAANPGTVLTFASISEPEPIEDAGIRAGEITAFRAWRIEGDKLFSVYIEGIEWKPGCPMTGDVQAGGVFSFKDVGEVYEYLAERQSTPVLRIEFDDVTGFSRLVHETMRTETFAIGTVQLWGQVIEHERGYRAQFAKIASLDHVIQSLGPLCGPDSNFMLADLRARYGVTETPAAEAQS